MSEKHRVLVKRQVWRKRTTKSGKKRLLPAGSIVIISPGFLGWSSCDGIDSYNHELGQSIAYGRACRLADGEKLVFGKIPYYIEKEVSRILEQARTICGSWDPDKQSTNQKLLAKMGKPVQTKESVVMCSTATVRIGVE